MRGREAEPAWGQAIPLYYCNHRGETRERRVVPIGLRFASTSHHPEPQWLLEVFDLDKQQGRSFALADCDFLGARLPSPTLDLTPRP